MKHFKGYQVDSRQIKPGELFFALPGEKTDGHLFLADVEARGGVGAVVSNAYQGPDYGLTLFPVEDVLATLQDMARQSLGKAQIIAITGSMGKTTTKDFTATLLEGKFRVGKTYSSYNTKLTLPITILNMTGDEEVLVLEMGMGEPGDIAKLVSIAPPDVAVLTKVGMAHYGEIFPGGVREVEKAKAEIFGSPRTKKAIVYHGFDLPLKCQKVIHNDPLERLPCKAPFPQPHVQYNFTIAVTVAREMGMEWDEIERQIPKLRLPKMRFEQFERDGILFVNDAYNANPESMKSALNCFPEPRAGGKRIAVLGRMIDLGPFSKAAHEEVGRLAEEKADCLLTLGDAMFSKRAEHFEDLATMKARLHELMRPGDVVLVKGSRDLAMERLFLK